VYSPPKGGKQQVGIRPPEGFYWILTTENTEGTEKKGTKSKNEKRNEDPGSSFALALLSVPSVFSVVNSFYSGAGRSRRVKMRRATA
jgi:hypothetical protein